MIVEEEREEGMETDAPDDSTAPMPPKEKAMSEDLKAGDHEDHCSQTSEESTDQNPPHDSDPDEDELLGPPTDISVPRGHSDDSRTHGLKWMGLGSLEPTSPASYNGS